MCINVNSKLRILYYKIQFVILFIIMSAIGIKERINEKIF